TPNLGSACAVYISFVDPDSMPALQLTPTYLTLFNSLVTQSRGVAFSILAGVILPQDPCDGTYVANDRVVGLDRARWNIHDRGTAFLSHIQMTGSASLFSSWVRPHLVDGHAAASASSLRIHRTRAAPKPACKPTSSGVASTGPSGTLTVSGAPRTVALAIPA